jgi:predicted DsbA family dithiol-disulfide isomerase
MKPVIKIDIASDVVCPWCYIGKRRLEKALGMLSEKYDFELQYHPFELNPDLPMEGISRKDHLIKKFGSEARYREIIEQTNRVALAEGLQFNLEKQLTSPNTRHIHRIIQYALLEDRHLEVVEAFFEAYFTKGIDLTKPDQIIDVAAKAGLPAEKVQILLSTDEGLERIEETEEHLQKLGITGVPFYIIENQYGISGAQPSESFIQIIEEVAAKKVGIA